MRPEKKAFILLISLFSIFACDPKEDVDPTVEAVQNVTFKKIMELSPFAAAQNISVSPNEKYMIFSYKENTAVKNYYSKDGGETAQELFIYGNDKDKPIQTNISNGGLFVTTDGGVYDLNNIRSGSAAFYYAKGVTDSGKLVYIQNDGANGKTFFIDNNGTYENTGVRLTMDENFYLGTSGEKMGFFDWRNRTIAEFDVSAQTYTQTTLTNLNYSQLYGLGNSQNKVKTDYSYGHFAYAKEGGVIIITPSQEIRYYDYPADYQIFQNTEGGMKLFGDHAYVNIFDRWGGKKVYVASGTTLEPMNHDFAVCRVGDKVYSQGFLENGTRFKSGIIKESDGVKAYLPLEYEFEFASNQMFGKTYVLGDYAYASDKVYDLNAETYATSPIGEIVSIYHDTGKTLAYTATGTYSSTDGKNWTEESTAPMKPELVTKGTDGKYHALNLTQQVYVSPSTQAKTYSVDIEAYVSSNGIQWELVAGSATNKSGTGPRSMTSDGKVFFLDNNVGRAGISFFSEDFGESWVRIVNGENTTTGQAVSLDFQTSEFELSNGKFLSVRFEFSGQMFLTTCANSIGDCTEIEIQPSFNTESMYQFDDGSTTLSSNDELVFNTLDGIYLSSSLK
ncbi:MAG: hypothetical protein COW03_03345 [Cytophagales bacterium CG12_big_fil_rev_8_21_14_0_65_40_12]|nr:MAG: hypothetical protein COW03_03345 [Cytophagales bacterium CG12_big_fil_rev_8_21_14_0_65_40_12]PIW04289.1 MAG: hypothetical protein COW40_10515 [Cytophagales bacterium CG17_big_fil_post_rev_8_21_14_2_50_40_13]